MVSLLFSLRVGPHPHALYAPLGATRFALAAAKNAAVTSYHSPRGLPKRCNALHPIQQN
jgi:hypothetical protein